MHKFNSVLDNFNILLASTSPRRREMFNELGINFKIIETNNSCENFSKKLKSPHKIACYLAEKKSFCYEIKSEKDILITADTIVFDGIKVMGKPSNYAEAFEMLKSLSNKTHQVVTGVCLRSIFRKKVFYATTEVSFYKLSNKEIDYYIKVFQPFDKAGAYGIQEWIGLIGVKKINGSYLNVVGLPMAKLYHELIKFVKN